MRLSALSCARSNIHRVAARRRIALPALMVMTDHRSVASVGAASKQGLSSATQPRASTKMIGLIADIAVASRSRVGLIAPEPLP